MALGDSVIDNYTLATTDQITARINFLKAKTDNYSAIEQAEIVTAIEQLQTRVGSNPANLLEVSTTELRTLKSDIEMSKKDLKIAEERVATLRHPERDKSYYESWFPINRPLSKPSIIIILAIGIFFFIISFFILMKAIGFNLDLSMPWDNPEIGMKLSGLLPPILVQNLNKIIIGIIIILIILYATKG